MSIELEQDTFTEIELMFEVVPLLLESFRHGTESIFVETFGGDYKRASLAYMTLSAGVKDFIIGQKHCDMPLDEALCAYVKSLEYFHYAVGMPNLFYQAIPKLSVNPVIDELKSFTSFISGNAVNMNQAHVALLSIDDVPRFIRKNLNAILPIIGKAMSADVRLSDLHEAVAGAHSLVHNFFWFLRAARWAEVDTKSKRVSPWICVSALCCVWYTMKHPLSYQPYWRLTPQKEGISLKQPTRSLLAALKDSQHDEVISDRMTLEHRHIWRHRLEWFCDSLNGQTELVPPKFAYRAALVSKIMEILRGTRDRASQIQMVNDFYDHVKSLALSIDREGER